jgi:hypothetical protein
MKKPLIKRCDGKWCVFGTIWDSWYISTRSGAWCFDTCTEVRQFVRNRVWC